jgi:hypothetical protein
MRRDKLLERSLRAEAWPGGRPRQTAPTIDREAQQNPAAGTIFKNIKATQGATGGTRIAPQWNGVCVHTVTIRVSQSGTLAAVTQ